MKFCFQYRTADNTLHEGVVSAVDRESAFSLLKGQGIKPSKLWEKPGALNVLFGKGKRWIAIGLLVCVAVIAVGSLMRTKTAIKFASEERAQLFGDPYILKQLSEDGWRKAFRNEGDAWFARHAIPGIVEEPPATNVFVLTIEKLPLLQDDTDELKKMKRMINCMKEEFEDYLQAGGSQAQYVADCDERLRVEKNIFEAAKRETAVLERRITECTKSNIEEEWNKKNAVLRSMGLMTIPFPEQ